MAGLRLSESQEDQVMSIVDVFGAELGLAASADQEHVISGKGTWNSMAAT